MPMAIVSGAGGSGGLPAHSGTGTSGVFAAWSGTATQGNATMSTTVLTGATQGSVVFVGSGAVLHQNNSALFWDNTNSRLGIGTATPSVALDVAGAISATGTVTLTKASGNALVVDTTTLIVDASNHWVGIGSAPTMPLTIGDLSTQLVAQKQLLFLAGVHTLSSNNGQTYYGSYGTIDVNQAGFSASGSAIGHRIYPRATGSSGTLSNAIGFLADAVNSGAGTITNGYGFWANGATNSGGGTFSAYTGFYVPANAVATTIYGLRSTLASNASRWNIYADGTAQNYLAGNLGIGSGKTTPAVALDITGAVSATGVMTPIQATGVTAGGALAITLGSSAPGITVGSGAPSLSAAKGSIYLRSDGSGTADRMYVNTNGSTTWTNLVTAA